MPIQAPVIWDDMRSQQIGQWEDITHSDYNTVVVRYLNFSVNAILCNFKVAFDTIKKYIRDLILDQLVFIVCWSMHVTISLEISNSIPGHGIFIFFLSFYYKAA